MRVRDVAELAAPASFPESTAKGRSIMPTFFNPTPEQRRELEQIAAGIPGVQQKLVSNHPQLTMADRGAHQQQLSASKVVLTVADALPAALDGLGVFQRGSTPRIGIGRMSTGMGCPHAETDADFLGLMAAFRAPSGRRIDFVTINDPTSPTDTPEEFLALLEATADAAGSTGLLATRARLLASLARHAGLRAPAIATHVTAQTHRTVRSTTAYQQYWTGIVRARTVLGKFTFVPTGPATPDGDVTRGAKYFTQEWRARQSAGPLTFDLRWIPFLNDRDTPLDDLTRAWPADHEMTVGTVTFPKIDPDSIEAKLTALLASELGANPGNWDETPEGGRPDLPATRFTAARQLAYRASQQARGVLPEERYASFFERGEISPELGAELIRRYQQKRAAGHWVPDVGELANV
jgi:hypothetical protein